MKIAALSFGRWILLGAILFAVGILTVFGARRRGSKTYGWRIALWALALSMMGGGAVMASPQTKGPDAAAIDNTGAAEFGEADEILPKCAQPMPTCYKPQPPKMCYRTLPPTEPPEDPPPVPPEDGDPDDDKNDGDKDEGVGDVPKPPVVMPSCYEAMPDPPPPPIQPTCYAPMPMPTCYEPMPPPPDPPPEEPDS